MNFLSHYYLHNDKNDNYFTVGLTLPDILGFHSKRIRLTKNYLKSISLLEKDDNFKSLIAGMFLHLELDRFFHNSDFFKESLDFVQNYYSKSNNQNLPHFYSHILVEILIDRYLLETTSGIADDFYSSYKKFNFSEITRLFENIKDFNKNKFLSLTESISNSSFLREYIHDNLIFSIFERVSRRIGMPILMKTDNDNFSSFVSNAYNELKPLIKNFLIFIDKICSVDKNEILNSNLSFAFSI
jgi:hypothetical protein